MKRKDKDIIINDLTKQINEANQFYLTDIADLDALNTSNLRRLCYKNQVELLVVKNKLLLKAFERSDKKLDELYGVLKEHTSIMFAQSSNAPAKLIKEFRKTNERPILKAAYVEESIYIGDNQIDALVNIKSKNELLGDIVYMLQSPIKNVMSSLQSGGQIIAGVVKTLSERQE